MNTQALLEEVRKEITRLQKVADLLEGEDSTSTSGRKGKGKGKRTLSAKARKAIGDAQRKRWAKVHAADKRKAA
jgi:hypothetical protein